MTRPRDSSAIPAILPEARETLRVFKAAGHHLILHSARCTPMDPSPPLAEEVSRFYATGEVSPRVTDQWARFEGMREALRAAGLWDLFDEVWQAPGKPHADIFVDDRFEKPDWLALRSELGVPSGHAT
jgi:hypothetical protein